MSDCGRETWGRVGVIANPKAGQGESALDAVLSALLRCLSGVELMLIDGTREAATAARCGVPCSVVPCAGRAAEAADLLLDRGVDVLVGVGGDGTLRDIAEVLARRRSEARLVGIGVGSSNVGPLVSATAAEVERFFAADWADVSIHALDVSAAGDSLGLTFHDATFSNAYFGTRDGERIDLDAVAALHGRDDVATPRSVCGAGTWIAKNGRRLLGAAELEGGQIVASPLNAVESCRGLAVSGFLCWGPYLGCRGLVAAASTVMIRTRLTPDDLVAAEPLCLRHVGLSPDDVVEVGGLLPGAAVIIDGNPTFEMGPTSVASLRLVENAVRVIRSAGLGA